MAENYNRLERRWNSFEQTLNENEDNTFAALTWMAEKDIEGDPLCLNHQAFKCLGDWLTSHKESSKNWITLIDSGLPLILWIDDSCVGLRIQNKQKDECYDKLMKGSQKNFSEKINGIQGDLLTSYPEGRVMFGCLFDNPKYCPHIPE